MTGSDRTLDIVVAEQVMQHQVSVSSVGIIWESGLDINTGGHADFLRPYSTSIVAAWKVVERFVDLGGNMTVCQYPRGASAQVWVPGLTFGFQQTTVIQAETVPLAICRAALAAIKG